MSKIDRGYRFLFSEKFGDENNEGGSVSKYSDGSRSFYGSDGSEGRVYTDGSGYYHGSDGSEGRIYTDGSGYYKGPDGSEGKKNSDGSGFFKRSDGREYCYEADENIDIAEVRENRRQENVELGETLIGLGLVAVSVLGSKVVDAGMELARRADEQERLEKLRRRELLHKYRKLIVFGIIALFSIIIGTVTFLECRTLTAFGVNSESLLGESYKDAVNVLKLRGFSNIEVQAINDLSSKEADQENRVCNVKLLWGNSFKESTKYPSNFEIVILYHDFKIVEAPLSSKELKGQNYLKVYEKFERAGFEVIEYDICYDIILGVISEDGEIKSVKIGDTKKFDVGQEFKINEPVTIEYRTLIGNKPDE